MIQQIQSWLHRRQYRVGRTLIRFVARDVRREVEILDITRLDESYITARIRTFNVLYVSKGLLPKTEFEVPREVAIGDLWTWTGQSWGGLPDGTSLAASVHGKPIKS
jgi:hypothetical protein